MSIYKFTAVALSSLIVLSSQASAGMRGAEFRTLEECLEGLQEETNSSLEILTDTPERVSGVLTRTNRPFMCDRKVTGTKGVYYLGQYQER